MLVRLLSAVAVIGALAVAPSQAPAGSSDAAATHAYLAANYAYSRASEALVKPQQAAAQRLNSRLAHECPKVGAGSPQTEASESVSYEVAVALWSVSYRVIAAPIRALVAALKPLRWSNPRITQIAHAYAGSLHELATLALPDVCADVSAWRASGYQTVPAGTISLQKRVEAIQPKPIPASLLASHESGADRGVLAATKRLETKLLNQETVIGFNDWDQVLATLGLQQ